MNTPIRSTTEVIIGADSVAGSAPMRRAVRGHGDSDAR
jgi:hypothetical protein